MDYQKINKENISKWEDALKYLTDILNEEDIKYYLSASGLHYILRKDVYPYDIDIFMSKEDVTKAFEFFKEYRVSNLHYCKENNRRYLEFQGLYNKIPFEICEWEEEPKGLKSVKFKDINILLIN
jgi:hypothetical protein